MSEIHYGAITRTDADCIEKCLLQCGKRVRFLEVGFWKGWTAKGIKTFCHQNGIELGYCGIDVVMDSEVEKFDGAFHIIGHSSEVWECVKGEFDIVFMDACHCLNHAILDAVHYGLFVRSGGFILFHDTLPSQQHVMTNRWVHGNEDRPIHRTAVRDALMLLEWPNDKWKLVMDEYDLNAEIGGMMVFQRQ